ncbi:MinD-like ATPase involved in chromosome partitioning or flagellar assembly [Cryobacterium mesophilum]|nr:regulator [Terrimesophilobacter mesophilus]MBB5632614.1 MinD-like ATPase involved in chromosome partitioning or flagellar assembly [Terrimesophilobacter mesophilus]
MVHSLAVFVPGSEGRRLAHELERNGHRVIAQAKRIDEIVDLLPNGELDAIVVTARGDILSSQLLALCDTAGVRTVALAASDGERRYAADLGLREVLDATASVTEIEALLDDGPGIGDAVRSAAGHVDDDTEPAPARGEVIAVWGPAGAPGRTTVAISIAAELAAEGFSVALADADTHSGSIAPTLGLLDEAPGFAAACRLAATDSLATSELERVAERYSTPHGSFWVLTGIGRPHRWPELSGDRVSATLAACRVWVDYTVVDTGFSLENDEEISSDLFAPRRNAATISALRDADRVVAVGAGDPVGLSRFLRAHVDLVDIVEAERVLTVMNRIRGSVIGANPSAQVEQTLRRFGGIVEPTMVPHDQGALDAAILAGKTLRDVAPKSGPRIAINRFVSTRIIPSRDVPARSPSARMVSKRISRRAG